MIVFDVIVEIRKEPVVSIIPAGSLYIVYV